MRRRRETSAGFGSVVDHVLSTFSYAPLREGVARRLRENGAVSVDGWRLRDHRPRTIGLNDQARLHADGTIDAEPVPIPPQPQDLNTAGNRRPRQKEREQ